MSSIAEETKNPSTVVPWAITTAALFTYIAGFLYNLVLAFSLGNPAEVLQTPTGMPVSQVFYNVMGPGPAALFSIAGFVIMNFACIPSIHAGSRTVWAFARDEMLPLSRVWLRLDSRTGTPLAAVWAYASLCVCVNLIGLGSHVLITAIFNVCAVALNWSYCIPIICKLLFPVRFDKGPWSLGRASVTINVVAIAWNAFLSVIFLLPTHLPVTVNNMNYAVVVLVATFIFSFIYWFAGGKKYYTGPRTNAQVQGGKVMTEESVASDDAEKYGNAETAEPDIIPTVDSQVTFVYDSGAETSSTGSSTTVYDTGWSSNEKELEGADYSHNSGSTVIPEECQTCRSGSVGFRGEDST
jgi:amino acid transporter